ncbi:MAG: Na+/H+ antiporter subunit E [Actinobacteria bacterium]|nr:Na+/H+ antiporter subunit E [Actinomycetota bacterium]MBO0838304.1 Na+/H+ antiporter subunit E [Actinomycetota bacterium]
MPDLTEGPEGRARQRQVSPSLAGRLGVWLAWWVLLMTLWIIADDSVAADELLAGAGAAALAALLAEVAGYQAETRLRLRAAWLSAALRLPADVARDTGVVSMALWRRLAHGEAPRSAFVEVPVRSGPRTGEGATRRALLIAGRSLAPNRLALGLDAERNVLVVHQLVADHEGDAK